MQPHIRWMIRRDRYEVLAIEGLCFEFPWRQEDFIRSLGTRHTIGMVAVDYAKDSLGVVVGFMIYELHKNRLHVLNFAVHPKYQRSGIGTAMVEKLRSKLNSCVLNRRNRIMLEVRETNVAAQLFFKSQGFRAISVLRDFYEDTAEDAYLMQYRVNELSEIGQ